MSITTRRNFLFAGAAAGAVSLAVPPLRAAGADSDDRAPAPPLTEMIRNPLLAQWLYKWGVGRVCPGDGAAGANCEGYKWIEEQRQGAEWIIRGTVMNRPEWLETGWRQLDWGFRYQRPDGSFDTKEPFHSSSLYLEALARACIVDSEQANPVRTERLLRGANALMQMEAPGPTIPSNPPLTHRRYVLAALFGQTAAVTGERSFVRHAEVWAKQGLDMQTGDGTNPEMGGFDCNYQMAGVICSLRYLPVCENPDLRKRLRRMLRKAIEKELSYQLPDGSINQQDSTRMGKETTRSGIVKSIGYDEVLQGLIFASMAIPQPELVAAAERIVAYRRSIQK